ncbi:transglycosylase family protein [Streptomyces sp. NPDC087850]|uniref:transglycosylase family protein n=1 Tax=Streptomyces sp. NPDC087850 TaxID=3365809 RepID=UPI0037FC2C71
MSRKIALAILPALAVASVALSTGHAAAAPATDQTYTVKTGDTLSRIADTQLGRTSAWQALYTANRARIGGDPNLIIPGQTLRLSAPAIRTAPSAQPAPVTPGPTQPNASATNWSKLAQCESSGNWTINTGNGYYGGLQFSLQTWHAFGGTGMPHQNSSTEQIRIAEKVLRAQGPGAWPHCSYVAGMR